MNNNHFYKQIKKWEMIQETIESSYMISLEPNPVACIVLLPGHTRCRQSLLVRLTLTWGETSPCGKPAQELSIAQAASLIASGT